MARNVIPPPPAMESRARTGGCLDPVGVGLLAGLGLYYLELLEASQDPYWLGGSWTDWYESLVGLGMYTFWPIACGLALRGLLRRSRMAPFAGLLGAGSGAALLWAWIRPDCSSLSGLDYTVPGVLLGLVMLLAAAEWTGPVSIGALAAAWSLAVLGGIAALREGSLLFILSSQRLALGPAVSLLWTAFAGIGGMAICVVAMRRELRPGVAAGLLVILCGALPLVFRLAPWASGLAQAPSDQPSVLLVTADSLRADACSVYGGEAPTPSLEALARRGVLFKRYYSTAPWTIPSLDSLFAGKYPPGLTPGASDEQHRREENSYGRLTPYWTDLESRTLMDDLRSRCPSSILFPKQYDTAAFVGNPVLVGDKWLQKSFDDFVFVESLWTERPARFSQIPLLRKRLVDAFVTRNEVRKVDSTWVLTRYTREFLRQHRNRPFFLWVHLMDPHEPYNPPAVFRTGSGPWQEFPAPGVAGASRPAWLAGLTEDERRYARSLYEGEVQYVDQALGEIMATWDWLGIREHGYLLFSSDHGEELWDHRGWNHGHSLYEELLHVPMVMMGPGLAPKVVEQRASAIDLMPTLAELVKVEPAPQWPGASLRRFLSLEDASAQIAPVFAQATHYRYKLEPQQMVLSGRHKLIRGLESGRIQLYDLTADPSEQHNVAQDNADTVATMGAALDVWSRSFPVSFGEFDTKWKVDAPAETSPEMEQIFRALGYLL